jgi:hypothetical protein
MYKHFNHLKWSYPKHNPWSYLTINAIVVQPLFCILLPSPVNSSLHLHSHHCNEDQLIQFADTSIPFSIVKRSFPTWLGDTSLITKSHTRLSKVSLTSQPHKSSWCIDFTSGRYLKYVGKLSKMHFIILKGARNWMKTSRHDCTTINSLSSINLILRFQRYCHNLTLWICASSHLHATKISSLTICNKQVQVQTTRFIFKVHTTLVFKVYTISTFY